VGWVARIGSGAVLWGIKGIIEHLIYPHPKKQQNLTFPHNQKA
jgi:hypothetical protein